MIQVALTADFLWSDAPTKPTTALLGGVVCLHHASRLQPKLLLMSMRLVLVFFLLLAGTRAALADNPFGVMLWPSRSEDLTLLTARANGLGVGWFRPPAQFIDRWRAGPCPSCDAVHRSGLAVALTVRNGGRDQPPHQPSTPPADLARYEQTLASILDAWKPAIVVVENEENLPTLYQAGDTPAATAAAYGRELAAACEIAHQRGIACTNGGLSFDAAAGLTWLDLLDRGKTDQACAFARRTFYDETDADAGQALCAYKTSAEVPPAVKSGLLHNAAELLVTYRDLPLDMVNFHWYGHDATALATAADTMTRLTGKPVMSNEIGQRRWDADPANVRPLLRAAFASGVNPAIWFSLDTPLTVSLFDQSGSLRPAGREFAHQMSGRK